MILHNAARRSRADRGRRGITLVETAFVMPVLFMFLLGGIDFALVTYAYSTVSESARCGARYAMVRGANEPSATRVGPTANHSKVTEVCKANCAGLHQDKITVTSSWSNTSNDIGEEVTVTVEYNCPLTVTKLINLGAIKVSGTTTMLITH